MRRRHQGWVEGMKKLLIIALLLGACATTPAGLGGCGIHQENGYWVTGAETIQCTLKADAMNTNPNEDTEQLLFYLGLTMGVMALQLIANGGI